MFWVTVVYILLSCSVLESKIDPTCISCIRMTRSGQGVAWTLLYHTHFSCQEEVKELVYITKQPILTVNKNANIFVLTPGSAPSENWLAVCHLEGRLLIN